MQTLIKLNKLFTPIYGVNLELVNVDECDKDDPESIRFVSRTEKNNGVSAYVRIIEDLKPNPGHTISVATSGSVLSSFYQPDEYYSGRDLYYLLPKRKMSVKHMLFYAYCLKQNKYKYNYGRAANRTLGDILIPKKIPNTFLNTAKKKILPPSDKKVLDKSIPLTTKKWKSFSYGGKGGLFEVRGGYYNKKPDHTEVGDIPFIGASEFKNGVTEYYSLYDIESSGRDEKTLESELEQKLFKGNCITIANNGASVCNAFYQTKEFSCSHDINILYLKNGKWSKYTAMFVCTIIYLEKYRWAYGRKWRPTRMVDSKIRLPATNSGKPDWKYMENYIKSLPYSASI